MTALRSMERSRAWRGPALLSFGFRPFFFGGAIWAAVAMGLWLVMLAGALNLPIRLDPISWHAHEFLFGYLGAITACFLLTAVPNWTGRLPIAGWPLGGLVLMWFFGRVAIATSALWPPLAVALVDLAFPVMFALVMGREIVAGRTWRNLMVLALFAALVAGNGIFHWEAAHGHVAAHGYGLRIGLATAIMMIAWIGGRIVPSFTRNWLVKRGARHLPVPPMARFDKVAVLALLAALLMWVARPESLITGSALLMAGAVHAVRLARWCGARTGAEPLVWVLHAGYAFVPLGAIAVGLSGLLGNSAGAAAAQHLWMAGGIGLMTVAVMTRASLGHTGRDLTAGPATTVIYLLVIVATLARVVASGFPDVASMLHVVAGLSWLGAFAGYAMIYGPLLITHRSS